MQRILVQKIQARYMKCIELPIRLQIAGILQIVFQKFKPIVNILIGSLGIWMCQRGQHHQIVPPPPMYFLDSFDM